MQELLQIRATLWDSEPEVWRRLVVDPRLTLAQMHDVLQAAFGWQNAHMHQFEDEDGTRYGERSDFDPDIASEGKVTIGQMLAEEGARVAYEYDFGDSWLHVLELETRIEGDDAQPAARCVAGERNGPPEDCGGLPGYFELVELKSGKKKRLTADDKERLEWLGDWDPEAFDLAAANVGMKGVKVKKGR